MTLEEHARVIEAAIQAAADDGYELDDTTGGPARLELNRVEAGVLVVAPEAPTKIYAPCSFYY